MADGDEWVTSVAVQVLESWQLAKINSIASDVRLTPAGDRIAQRIRVMRSGQWRTDDVQRAILMWLAHHDDGVAPGLDGFLHAPEAADLTPPVTMREAEDAIELLGDHGYVKSKGTYDGTVAMITAAGRAALKSGLQINEYGRADRSDHTTYDNRSTVNIGDQAQIGGFQPAGMARSRTSSRRSVRIYGRSL